MSLLRAELERQIELTGLKQVQVAEASGIDQSQISDWLTGRRDTISPKQLSALALALGKDPHEQARLYIAHLKDEIEGAPNANLVDIAVKAISELKDKNFKRSAFELALAWLNSKAPKNKDIREGLVRFHKLMGSPEP